MTKNYEPTKREIRTEILRDLRGLLSKENLSRTGKSLKKFGAFAGGVCGAIIVIPYCIPTAIRGLRETESQTGQLTLAENVAGWTGAIPGAAIDVVQGCGYHYLATHNHPEVLAVPVATNVVSGLYEVSRAVYKNARQKLIGRHNREITDTLSD